MKLKGSSHIQITNSLYFIPMLQEVDPIFDLSDRRCPGLDFSRSALNFFFFGYKLLQHKFKEISLYDERKVAKGGLGNHFAFQSLVGIVYDEEMLNAGN